MSGAMGAVRRLAMAPSLDSVTFAGRGFPVTPSAATAHLESIPQAVVCGFEWGIEAGGLDEIERRLGMLEREHRGFGYEGAAMALTILDVLPFGRRDRTARLLDGPAGPHIFLAYIGIGFAMARLPRMSWSRVLPDLTPSVYHPTMSWLAVDGYGFDRAYFDTRRWVDEQYVGRPYPWQGHPDYFHRAVDQGIGRALWFVNGGDPVAVAAAVHRFAPTRRGDLWSGVGLAATYAGGCDGPGLTGMRAAAGVHADDLALGSVFGATARTHGGFVPAHTRTAVAALCDLTVESAFELGDRTTVPFTTGGPRPPYEVWRHAIRSYFTELFVTGATRLTG